MQCFDKLAYLGGGQKDEICRLVPIDTQNASLYTVRQMGSIVVYSRSYGYFEDALCVATEDGP
jgi:hypothetical protein